MGAGAQGDVVWVRPMARAVWRDLHLGVVGGPARRSERRADGDFDTLRRPVLHGEPRAFEDAAHKSNARGDEVVVAPTELSQGEGVGGVGELDALLVVELPLRSGRGEQLVGELAARRGWLGSGSGSGVGPSARPCSVAR
jgi:hypothetical protein